MARHLQGEPPALWDPVVRLSHWVIAAVVVGNGLLTEGGGVLHVWLGWIGLAFLVLRLGWALVGPSEARFSSFPPHPRRAFDHVRKLAEGRVPEYRSHNPAGALMVYALWASLAVVIATGLWMTGGETPLQAAERAPVVRQIEGAQAFGDADHDGDARGEDESLVKDIHEIGANLLLFLAVLHLGGVAVESVALRRNLVRPMIFGQRKRFQSPGE